jgi:hypothetical protein
MANGKNTTKKKAPQRATTAPALIAWYVAERGEQRFWTRIGAAWNHLDGEGMTVRLDLMPPGGEIVLRVPKQPEEGAA